MRFVRIPYIYLPTVHLKVLVLSATRLLGIIHDIHHNIPNKDWNFYQVKAFMYHPVFLRWVFIKAETELKNRGCNLQNPLQLRFMRLKSRKLSDFVPPTDSEIAEDVVWLLDRWKAKYFPGGIPLPYSYVELAETIHGYSPQQAALQRVDEASGRHRNDDREWYHPQGEEAPQIFGDTVAKGVRRCGNERRE